MGLQTRTSRRAPLADCMLCSGAGGWRDSFGWVTCPCTTKYDIWVTPNSGPGPNKAPSVSCPVCGGRGGLYVNGKWLRCQCVKTTANERKLHRAAQNIRIARQGKQQQLF